MTETTKRRRELLAILQETAERIYLCPSTIPDTSSSKPDSERSGRIYETPLSKSAADDLNNRPNSLLDPTIRTG